METQPPVTIKQTSWMNNNPYPQRASFIVVVMICIILTQWCAICLFSGVTNLDEIQSNVKTAIAGKFPLYCLGFGFDVNFEFLESMALQNDGAARRIYEDADANLQLQVFQTIVDYFKSIMK